MSLLTIVASLKKPFHLSTQGVLRGGARVEVPKGFKIGLMVFGAAGFWHPLRPQGMHVKLGATVCLNFGFPSGFGGFSIPGLGID